MQIDKSKAFQVFIAKFECNVTSASAQNPELTSLPLDDHKGIEILICT